MRVELCTQFLSQRATVRQACHIGWQICADENRKLTSASYLCELLHCIGVHDE